MRTPKAYKPPILEKHVQQTVTEFLQLDGWRPLRMEGSNDRGFVRRAVANMAAVAQLKPFIGLITNCLQSCWKTTGVGELAMPDYLYIRYGAPMYHGNGVYEQDCQADVLWIEFKRKNEQPKTEQLAWHEAERKRGAMVMVVDDIDAFIAWYKTSGLQRR